MQRTFCLDFFFNERGKEKKNKVLEKRTCTIRKFFFASKTTALFGSQFLQIFRFCVMNEWTPIYIFSLNKKSSSKKKQSSHTTREKKKKKKNTKQKKKQTMATRSRIPKIIHQTWETLDVPEIWKEAEREWRKFCAENEFEYRLWTAADRRALVAEKFAWYLPTFDALPMNVQRADAWRYFALYVYGGIYIDLDFVPKHTNMKALLQYYDSIEASVVIAKSATSKSFKGEVLTNACMMSEKEAPFWKVVWDELKQPLSKGTFSRRMLRHIPYFQVIFGTGPGRINLAMQKYLKMEEAKTHPFVMIPAEFISCGFEWEKKPFETQESAVKLLAGSSWHTKSMRIYRHISRAMSQYSVLYIVVISVMALVIILLMIFLILAQKKNKKLEAENWF